MKPWDLAYFCCHLGAGASPERWNDKDGVWMPQWQLLWTLKLEYLNRSGGISQWSTMWHSDLPLIRFWSRWNAVPHSWVRIYEKTAVSVVSASIGGRRSWLKKHPTKKRPPISMLSNRSTERGLWNMFVACILIVVCCIMLFPHSFGSPVDLVGCRRKKQVGADHPLAA